MVKKVESNSKNKISAPQYLMSGDLAKNIDLPEKIFAITPNNDLIAQYVRVYLANKRQYNVATKTRSEVIGSTKKLYRQKGTGRARHSTSKANLFRGGGVTFGPQPRDVSLTMNKKQKLQALFSSLSLKASSESVLSLDTSDFSNKPKTKDFNNTLKKITKGGKVLVVLEKVSKSPFVLSLRNIKNVNLAQATSLNAYDVLNHKEILFIDNSINALENHFIKS